MKYVYRVFELSRTMKRTIIGGALGILTAAILFAQNSPEYFQVMRGMTLPAVCRLGDVFVDMTPAGALDGLFVCTTNSAWEQAGYVPSGTANSVTKFDTATTLTDSSMTDDGVTVDMTVADLQFTNNGVITSDVNFFLNAGASQDQVLIASFARAQFVSGVGNAANTSLYDFVTTIPITAAAQTTIVIDLSLTNSDHTGGTVNAINIGGITGDAQATENALSFGAGWDYEISGSSLTVLSTSAGSIFEGPTSDSAILFRAISTGTARGLLVATQPTAGIGGDIVNLNMVLNAMDAAGGDVINGLNIELTNADHTGGTLNGITIGNITGDAQATENAINIGDGWDWGITADDSGIQLAGTGEDSGLLFADTVGGTYTFQMNRNAGGSIIDHIANTGFSMDFRLVAQPANDSGYRFLTDTIPITAAAQTTDVFRIAITTNGDHTGGTVNGFAIDAITGDAQATERAISLGSGWDSGIFFDDDLTDYMTFENGNGSVRREASPSSFIFPLNGPFQKAGGTPNTLGGSVNNVRVYRFFIPYRLTVSRIAWGIGTGGAAGAECSMGVYSSDGNTLILNSGAQDCTVTGLFDIDVADVTIGPGQYILAVTADDAAVAWDVFDGTADTDTGEILNGTVVHIGNATNTSTDAVLPATLGALTGVDNRLAPVVKLQG